MQNTYQEKLADLEVNNSKKIKKLEGGINFKIKSDFQPSGDQPEAIKQILKKSNLKIISANNLADAAKKIVKQVE